MDEAFGPEPHRPSDFLLIFEQLCSLVPALLTIFHVPFSIARAFNSRRCVEISPLFWLKLTVVGILSAVQINIVFQWWHLVPVGTRLARASAQAAYVGMPSLALISCLDHLYSPYGDSFLSAILSATILLDAAAFATYFYPPELGDATTPCWTFVALKLSLLVLEQFPKRRLLDRESSPNEMDNSSNYAGFWHAPLWRLAKLYLFLGFSFNLRKDFFPSMEDEARAETLYKGFLLQWEKVDKSSQLSLIKAYFHTKPDLFFAIIMPRLLEAGFTIAKPFLARDVLITISAPHVPADLAMKLIAATAVIFLGTMVSVTWAGRAKARLAWTLEQLLKAATYNKCLALAASELDAAEALAIMSKDIDNATAAITIFSCDWAVAAEVISCLIGLTSVSSIFILACLSPFIFAAKTVLDVHRMGLVDRKKWQHAAEDHIAFVSNVLSQLRDIKMLGLGSALAKVMRRYQEDEIHASAQAGMAEIFNTPGGAFVETVTPLVAVGIALLTPHALHMRSTADYAGFIGIALLLADILGTVIRMLNHRLVGIDSLRRLRDFMVKRENEDSRVYAPTRLLGSVHATPAVLSRESRPGANRRANELSEIVFQFIDASLSFEDETVLKNVSLRIPRGKVTMIVGSVGCGKSTFLRSMIGQVQLSGGSLLVASSSVAYCSQKPWIRNLSIRDNILGEKPLIRPWLNLVLYVCALDIDLARLPNGELTIAGSDGCNLSGGQKQRVAFARALYAKKEILVVDDIFAVLDKNTSSAIRIRLFGETEILSANNMTLVMSTALREHTVDADLVFEISDQGQVRERSEASREASPSYTPRRPRGAQLGTSEVSDETSDAAEDDEPPPADPVPHLYLPANAYNVPDPIWGKFNDFSLYKYFYLGPAGNLVSFIFCSVVSVAAVTEVASGVFIYFWIVTDPENRLYLLVYAGFCLGNPAFNFFCKVSYYYLVYPRTARALYSKVAEAIHRATLDHLSSTDTNFLLNKFTQDVLKTTESLPRLTLPIVWGIILVGIFFITFYWASSTLVLPIGLAISELAISFFERRASHQVGILDGTPHEKLSKLTTDTSTGCEHIYAFCWQNDFLRHFYNGLNEIDQSRCRRSFLRLWCAAMSNIVAAIAAISTVTLAVTSKEPVSQIAMGFAFIAMTNFGVQINLLAICFSAADAALHGAGQIRKFIQSTPQERDPKEYEAVPLEWPDRGRIQLNCVTAQYRPFGGVRHTALDHVSFTVEPGQVVGISGRTGSGKTTLFLAILNLLEFEGSISIDNREIRGLPRDILRSRITTMTQSGLELKGTVRLNLNPFDPALRPRELLLTDDMLIGILRRVGLWERIEARGGLDAPFHRMKFSNGHKKLFHLARAMLHKQMMRTRIVLIDEGAPNAEIEDYMRQVMREVFAGCTILMVSHRPSLFREADLIITVDRGQTTTYEHSRQSDRWSVSRWSRPMD